MRRRRAFMRIQSWMQENPMRTNEGNVIDNKNLASDPARDDLLVVVDGLDRKTGTATKVRAHAEGLLHRAFSVVLLRDGESGPELLLSKRASCKYHSGGLWANSCCSHPRDAEDLLEAAQRRLHEELGCSAEHLREIGAFVYRAAFDNGLCEHEYDHVLLGHCVGEPSPDPSETSETRWISFDGLAAELANEPQNFSAWAPTVLTLAMNAVLAQHAERTDS